MRVLAVGASLSTLLMSLALRSKGISVQIAEQHSQQQFMKKLNMISRLGSKTANLFQNNHQNPIHLQNISSNLELGFFQPKHCLKHSFANLESLKALETFRMQNDDRILKLPINASKSNVLNCAIYNPSGSLDLGIGFEFIPSIQEILDTKKSIYNSIIQRTSIHQEYLFHKVFQQMKLIDSKSFQFSKKYINYRTIGKNQGVEVEFEDGSKEFFDFIICGDAEATHFRESLNQKKLVKKASSVSGIVNSNVMNDVSSLLEVYRGKNCSFMTQKLHEGLWKWTTTTLNINDTPQDDKKGWAQSIVKNLPRGSSVIDETPDSCMFVDDFAYATYEPRGVDTIFIDPLIVTGRTMLGEEFNHPLLDIATHLNLINATYMQQALSKPQLDFFNGIIVGYERQLAFHQDEVIKTITLFNDLMNNSTGFSGIFNTYSIKVFKYLWKNNVTLYNSTAQRSPKQFK